MRTYALMPVEFACARQATRCRLLSSPSRAIDWWIHALPNAGWLAAMQAPRSKTWRFKGSAAHDSPGSVPHPKLTRLSVADTASAHALAEGEKALLLEDAMSCVQKLRDREETVPHVETAFVAAALAIMCGRFPKKNGKPNPSAAAEACGKSTKKPSAVAGWIEHLTKLEEALVQEEAIAERRRRDEADEARSKAESQKRREELHALNEAQGRADRKEVRARLEALVAEEEARADAAGLFVRIVQIASVAEANVKQFAEPFLELCAAFGLEYEADDCGCNSNNLAVTTWGERYARPRPWPEPATLVIHRQSVKLKLKGA